MFKVVPNDDLLAAAILKYIAKTGVKKLGYIGVSDGYGEGYYKALSQMTPKLGITLTTHEVYGRGDSSVTGQVLKIIATNPDAVFIASAGTPAVLPQKALRERGYKGPIFQTHGVSTEQFIKLGGKDVEGTIYAGEVFTVANDLPASSPFRKSPEQFTKAYEAVHGGEAPNIFGAHLWDTMVLVEHAVPGALKHGKPGTAAFRSALRDRTRAEQGRLPEQRPVEHEPDQPQRLRRAHAVPDQGRRRRVPAPETMSQRGHFGIAEMASDSGEHEGMRPEGLDHPWEEKVPAASGWSRPSVPYCGGYSLNSKAAHR